MKKIFALLMILLYTTAGSGMVVNMHYCMGKLSSVKVVNVGDKTCLCGDDEPSGECCFDDVKMFKADDAQKATAATFNISLPTIVFPTTISLIDLSRLQSQQLAKPVAHAPPHISAPPVSILHCVFLI